MRRFLTPPLALIAGLAIVLSGCAGETPTTPTGNGNGGNGNGGGTCNVAIALISSSASPLAGSAVFIRASATRSGAPIPDGASILFTTDYGFFLETGLPTVSKIVVAGVAEVTLASDFSGRANVKAVLECATALTAVNFGSVPTSGPFVSSITPDRGTCAGGTNITINGGRFGNDPATTRVSIGGQPATIISVTDTVIVVKTPARTLANRQVPETVDIVITVASGTITKIASFTYFCVDRVIFISSVIPNSGPPEGGTSVVINGGNFGTNIATTRVTFGGVSATITGQTDNAITVLTPRHPLANPSIPETVDVVVTIDLGLVSQQSAIAVQAFTYRASGTGGPGVCLNPNSNPALFISRVTPNTGSPDGGTSVTIEGGGFGTNSATTRVDIGGVPAQILTVTNNTITVSTPRRALANPDVPESVDVIVTIDVGGPNQSCAISSRAFTYTRAALEPVIFSSSPKTGPNDASTRVTIFGTGFQFPEQVFLTCGSVRIEAAVVSIKSDQIVFLTPIAANGNSCLQNALTSIIVLNPQTGKTATCVDCFKYYDCPAVFGVSPQQTPYNQTNTLSINGRNFEEPVEASLTTTCSNVSSRIQVTSVSSSIITVQVPPIDPLQCASCSNVQATITLTFQSLSCPALSTTFSYRVDPVTISTVGPQQLNQDGSPLGSPLGSAPQTITVTGSGFQDPMTSTVGG
ncbi:MAG: IPT/TIG domain-containing protein, partial [Thermoanaerobaculia bacterium]